VHLYFRRADPDASIGRSSEAATPTRAAAA
jgi:hypothetical protein